MNKQDANTVRLILRTAAEAGLLSPKIAEEISQNTHIFLRKNHFRWKIQRFERRVRELEEESQDVKRLLSSLGLVESSLAKIAARHSELALELKHDLASSIEEIDVELPTDPTRIPSQDVPPPADDPDPLALAAFQRDSESRSGEAHSLTDEAHSLTTEEKESE